MLTVERERRTKFWEGEGGYSLLCVHIIQFRALLLETNGLCEKMAAVKISKAM
jgi:hypothetical protein